MKKLSAVLLALLVVLSLASTAAAAEAPQFSYELQLTDQNGMPVTNLRGMSTGATLHVEIVLTRTDTSGPYDMFGIEFRLLTQGLKYNNDGKTLRNGTSVVQTHYSDGDSVGFAWYDMQQVGERTNNPVLAGSWSYTVTDPSAVNISVPVALVYVTGHTTDNVPVGSATLNLEPDGGTFLSENISGSYPSGTVVILPDMEKGGWIFAGWSDGKNLYPAGSEYVVSGYVTLTAQWEEMERNRQLKLDPNGGEIIGEDVSGHYADGMVVQLPDAQREGYSFLGWSDGTNVYAAGEEYTVNNTVILIAQWEIAEPEPGPASCIICGREDLLVPGISLCWICLLILLLILLGIMLIILLWKRRFVKYSLVSGDIELNFMNGSHDVQVEVVLIDDGQEYSLNQSVTIKAKQRLQFIRNVMNLPVADIKPGKYEGKLIITRDRVAEVTKCQIMAVDKELTEQ